MSINTTTLILWNKSASRKDLSRGRSLSLQRLMVPRRTPEYAFSMDTLLGLGLDRWVICCPLGHMLPVPATDNRPMTTVMHMIIIHYCQIKPPHSVHHSSTRRATEAEGL